MKAMKFPSSPTNPVSTHNKQVQAHKQISIPAAPDAEKPQTQNGSTRPDTHIDVMPKAISQQANVAFRTPAIVSNNLNTLTQSIETSITTITKLSDSDINRLGILLPKEQLNNLTKTNSTNNSISTGVDLLTLKIPNKQEPLNAIAKSGWKVGAKIHLELPIIAPPKLFILEEKRSQHTSTLSTLANANNNHVSPKKLTPKHTSSIDALTHSDDTKFSNVTRKTLIDVGLRKYLPQQIHKSLAGKFIDQLTSSKYPLAQANQNIHSTQLKQATIDVIKSLGQLEKISINPMQTVTPAELKSAIKNSGIFFESHIKSNIKHVTQSILSEFETPTIAKTSTTNALSRLNNNQNIALDTSINNTNHTIESLNEDLKHHDLKAVLLNLVDTITKLQNTSKTQVTHPVLNLTGFDKLLKTLLTPKEPTKKEANIDQQHVLDNIKMLASNVLNRISTNQLLSLSQNQSDHTTQTFVSLDIPIKVGDQCLPLHMQIEERVNEKDSNDENKNTSDEGKNDRNSLTSSWHVILEFSFLEQGDFYSTVHIYGDTLKSTLWAENPNIQQQLNMYLPKLEAQLIAQGIIVDELRTVKNKPVGRTNQIKHHLVDINT